MDQPTTALATDIAVIGGGPAGLAVALAVAAKGRPVTLLAPDLQVAIGGSRAADARTTAVLGDNMVLIENLGVWDELASLSAPLTGIRIIDDRDGWLRAPEVLFDAREMGRADFGYNIPNDPLRAALLSRGHSSRSITMVETAGVAEIVMGRDSVALTTKERGRLEARLVIAADGRRSIARAAAGIAERSWSYPQVAIATSFNHGRPHAGVSNELHRRAGPLTTVPLPDDAQGPRSSLVWVETHQTAERLLSLGEAAFRHELAGHLADLLGPIGSVAKRGAFPLSGLMAVTAGRGRIVLAGEAAHVVPPIGAQGLNLGLRDAATIADAVAGAEDPGSTEVVAAYARARAADFAAREIGIDLLNRALLSNLLPLQALRGAGLHLLAGSGLARRLAMELGLNAPGAVPSLMRRLANPG